MKTVPTYTAEIYVSIFDDETEDVYQVEINEALIEYIERGACVSVDCTTFMHTDDVEKGYVVRLINYPRFPSTPDKIKAEAIELAKKLKKACKQKRVSIVCTDETIMLEEDE